MAEESTPSWSEFVKRHRARESVHEEAERIATTSFDWVDAAVTGVSEATIGALAHHRDNAGDRDDDRDRDPGH